MGKGGPAVFGFRFSAQIITKVFHRISPSTETVNGTSGFPRVILIFSFGKYLKILNKKIVSMFGTIAVLFVKELLLWYNVQGFIFVDLDPILYVSGNFSKWKGQME